MASRRPASAHFRQLLLVLCVAACAVPIRAQQTDAKAPEPFTLTRRTPYSVQESEAVRIDTSAAGAEWRVIAAPTAVDFDARLRRAEGDSPFDLVFPLAVSPAGAQLARPLPPHSGMLADRFEVLALPNAGLEFRVAFDGTWDVAERSPGRTSDLMLGVRGMPSLPIDSLNDLTTASVGESFARAWTYDFARTPQFRRMLDSLAGGSSLVVTRLWQTPWPGEAWRETLHFPVQSWSEIPAQVSGSAGSFPSVEDGQSRLMVWCPPEIGGWTTGSSATKAALGLSGMAGAERCPTIVGGALAIVRGGKWVGPEAGTGNASALAAPYAWIGLSYRTGEVWLGCTSRAKERGTPLPPRELADLLEPQALDYVGICCWGSESLAMRWQGKWLGERSASDPGNVCAALCYRAHPPAGPPRWVNLLRNWRVSIEPGNLADAGSSPDRIRDGRIRPGAPLDTFWWATAREADKPVTLDIDLQQPQPVYWIEMLHAQAAGFSADFNLPEYTWEMRVSPSSPWQKVIECKENRFGITRHILSPPVEARYWRLVIPPPADPTRAPVIRLAEVGFWAPSQ